MTDSRNDLAELGRLRRHLEPDLTAEDVERLVQGGAARRQRSRNRRTLGAGLILGAISTAAVLLLFRFSSAEDAARTAPNPIDSGPLRAGAPVAPSEPATHRAPEILSLRDRSRAMALEAGTQLFVEEDAPERVHLRLERGLARFEVTRRPERSFSVRAGGVTVSVVGTIFRVEVVADRVGVSVESGAVEVDWGIGQKRLLGGERGWFPPLVTSVREPDAAEPSRSAHASPEPSASSGRESGTSAQSLLAAVDASRSRGQPGRAVELLRQILRDYPDDPRAPLAAFTLGRVLLNELGRPREAAAAFRQVRTKAPASQFAEDALAREAEAWDRASEPERARALAAEYLERYPAGRHARRVKALVGLE